MAVFSRYWEKEAINLIAFDLLTLIEWCHEYLLDLKRFGISDVYLKNGFTNLCDAYTRKIHSTIYKMITNVIIQDADFENSTIDDDVLATNSPEDMFKILSDFF